MHAMPQLPQCLAPLIEKVENKKGKKETIITVPVSGTPDYSHLDRLIYSLDMQPSHRLIWYIMYLLIDLKCIVNASFFNPLEGHFYHAANKGHERLKKNEALLKDAVHALNHFIVEHNLMDAQKFMIYQAYLEHIIDKGITFFDSPIAVLLRIKQPTSPSKASDTITEAFSNDSIKDRLNILISATLSLNKHQHKQDSLIQNMANAWSDRAKTTILESHQTHAEIVILQRLIPDIGLAECSGDNKLFIATSILPCALCFREFAKAAYDNGLNILTMPTHGQFSIKSRKTPLQYEFADRSSATVSEMIENRDLIARPRTDFHTYLVHFYQRIHSPTPSTLKKQTFQADAPTTPRKRTSVAAMVLDKSPEKKASTGAAAAKGKENCTPVVTPEVAALFGPEIPTHTQVTPSPKEEQLMTTNKTGSLVLSLRKQPIARGNHLSQERDDGRSTTARQLFGSAY
jgi:hypothetical protein